MAGKVINRSFGILSKFGLGGQLIAPKTATSNIPKSLNEASKYSCFF